MNCRALAAITLHPKGGGVAAASRLMWRVFQEQWGSDSRLVTLLTGDPASTPVTASASTRVQFGARLAKAQLLRECDAVFYTHLAVAQVQSYLPAAIRRPYGVFLHGIEIWRPLGASQRRVLEDASVLVANSAYTVQRIRATHPWMPPVAECALALPPAHVDSATAAVRTRQDIGPRAVLVVARMDSAERYKGHDQLLEAWQPVVRRAPDAKLIFAGAGDDVARLEARAADLGVTDSVFFTGFVSQQELASLYERAALFAMPSRNEGFGLVYLEAMSHGLPCIGSVHDAARDVIDDGRTGFLVDQADVVTLADRISTLLADRDMRVAMGEAGRRRLEERFSYTQFRDRFLSALGPVLGPVKPIVATGASVGARTH